MRALSAAFKAALLAERTDEEIAILVTVAHPDLDQTLRCSSHPTTCLGVDPLSYGTVSRGETFDFLDSAASLPEDADGAAPVMELRFDNIGRQLTELARLSSTPATVTVEIVSIARPDLVEVEFPEFTLGSVDVDEEFLTASLHVDILADEGYPAGSFTPDRFRALF